MNDEMAEIREEFILEAREHLAVLESALLSMEQSREETTAESINTIFRAIHSLKGGVSFLGYEAPKNLSHAMESVLMQARDGHISVDTRVAQVLLQSFDVLRIMLEDLDSSAAIQCDSILQELQLLMTRKHSMTDGPYPNGSKSNGSAPPFQTPDLALAQPVRDAVTSGLQQPVAQLRAPSDAEMREASTYGYSMYRITATASSDPNVRPHEQARLVASVARIGRCLATEILQFGGQSRICVLCTSVLDRGAMREVLKLSEDAIEAIELTPARNGSSRGKESSPDCAPEQTAPSSQSPRRGFDTQKPERPTYMAASGAEEGRLQTSALEHTELHESAPPSVAQPLVTTLDANGPASTSMEYRGATAVKETLRVRVELLSRLMNVAGELVLGRNQLLRALKDSADTIPGLVSILQHIDRVTTELQEGVMQTRMQPMSILFGRQQRLVRDMSQQLGKPVRMEVQGGEVELDKSILEGLADPLIHIIRNCIDHGIEPPAVRKRLSKPAQATVAIRAYHEGGQVNVEVSDDGQGIDRAKVIAKALEKRLISAESANDLSDREVINLIFLPGFSTAEIVSDVSGRGVGMDVVRTNIERLGGHVEIQTQPGRGTTVRLRLPLTLAIIPSLIVRVGDSRFAVPQANIVELVRIQANEGSSRIERVQGAPVLRLRERLLSLIHLGDVLGIPSRTSAYVNGGRNKNYGAADSPNDVSNGTEEVRKNHRPEDVDNEECFVLVLRAGANKYGVIVDELQEWEEIVVKPAPTHLKGVDCFAGTTILGDGCVIMILDTGGLASRAKLSFANMQREEHRRSQQAHAEANTGALTYSVILFEGAPNEVYAVPQDRVLRLERVRFDSLRKIGNQQYIPYRGRGLRVFPLDRCLPVSAVPSDSDEVYLVIPRGADGAGEDGASAGLLIWKVLDALDVSLVLQKPMFSGPGVLGCALVQETLTTFIDPTAMIASEELLGGAP